MKNLILFLFAAMFLMSCGGAGKEPTDLITWGAAFNHCIKTTGYVVFLILSAVLLVGASVYSIKNYKSGKWEGMKTTLVIALALAVFMCCLFIRPSEIAANTTVEQAARGAWIGY